jgi:tetratricopeptide (TPR) repeat protein
LTALVKFSDTNKNELLLGVAFVFCVLFSAFIFLPGISGDFLLDDYENLRKLETISSLSAPNELLQFLSSGLSSKLGRPVSLFSFALQHYNFPNPWAFKYVNVLLHLVNGCLVFWLILLIARLSNVFGDKAKWVVYIATAIWLIHPIQISTVQYVIQRMTELSAMFTLIGIIMYVVGRMRISENRPIQGYIWASLGVVIGGGLATLSKENGILLPLYILVLEYTLFWNLPKSKQWFLWASVFLLSPLLILLIYIGWHFNGVVLSTYNYRDFTLGERILTETRVLTDYLFKVLVPHPKELGLYHDDFEISKSLFNPISTLFSSILLIFLFASAFLFKNRAPLFSFAMLWFFAGHLLESTIIPLEIYFEHRNYLPLLGLIIAIVYYATRLPSLIKSRTLQNLTKFVGVVYCCILVGISYQENKIWGNVYNQASVWASEKPKSRRAQDALGAVLTASGQYHDAAAVYQRMSTTFPNDSFGYVMWLSLMCLDKNVSAPPLDDFLYRLEHGSFLLGTLIGFDRIITAIENKDCEAISYESMIQMLETVTKNPKYSRHSMHIHLYLGRLHATQGLLAPALMEYDKAFDESRKPDIALRQVQWLYSAGRYRDALVYLEKAEKAAERNTVLQVSLNPVFAKWREVLVENWSIKQN